jgi:hypothetical protein
MIPAGFTDAWTRECTVGALDWVIRNLKKQCREGWSCKSNGNMMERVCLNDSSHRSEGAALHDFGPERGWRKLFPIRGS